MYERVCAQNIEIRVITQVNDHIINVTSVLGLLLLVSLNVSVGTELLTDFIAKNNTSR